MSEWVRDEAGRLRRAVEPSMLRRLKGWDYRGRAIYMITVVLADRSSEALGRLEVTGEGGGVSARVIPSAYGAAAIEALGEMSRRYPQVEILAHQLMPDHIHFVAFVKTPLDRPFGALVRGFKAGAARRWREIDSANNGRAQDIDSANNGRAQDIDSANNGRAQGEAAKCGRPEGVGRVPTRFRGGAPSWAEGFQDTVLLHEGQLGNMLRYLADNPRRLAIKRLRPDLFRVVKALTRPTALGEARFMALGNRFLLDRPLAQIQVSRRDFGYKRLPKPGGGVKIARDAQGRPIVDFATPAFAEKRDALLAAARHGAVLLSPCVSDGEREIARLALDASLPLVAMKNKGFSPLEKPSGRHFDACTAGRLLLLAPAAWPYTPGEKPTTRLDAVAMNRLCQLLAGEDAAEINYHGMKPNNIDALALAAVKESKK